jgi:hypothetical protein
MSVTTIRPPKTARVIIDEGYSVEKTGKRKPVFVTILNDSDGGSCVMSDRRTYLEALRDAIELVAEFVADGEACRLIDKTGEGA